MDLFKNQKQETTSPPMQNAGFPNFNTTWIPHDESIKTKTGKNLDKGTDILKKTFNFVFVIVGLIILMIFLPTIFRFFYEFSSWAYDEAGNIFP
ncbi:hypothetical protein QUF70_03880 [Desulfobacterales bacterium HSG17]|nr:hypothetical protein [Desulfobacterales bacterium HSG17]